VINGWFGREVLTKADQILALFDRPPACERGRLVEATRAVVNAVKQTEDGQWIVTGDGEVLMCALDDALSLSAAPSPPVGQERGPQWRQAIKHLKRAEWQVDRLGGDVRGVNWDAVCGLMLGEVRAAIAALTALPPPPEGEAP
jgi:hypothetical protein